MNAVWPSENDFQTNTSTLQAWLEIFAIVGLWCSVCAKDHECDVPYFWKRLTHIGWVLVNVHVFEASGFLRSMITFHIIFLKTFWEAWCLVILFDGLRLTDYEVTMHAIFPPGNFLLNLLQCSFFSRFIGFIEYSRTKLPNSGQGLALDILSRTGL